MSGSRNKPLFNSPEHEELVRDVVRDHPPRPGEDLLAYLDRIAVEAALIKPGEGLIGKQNLKPITKGE